MSEVPDWPALVARMAAEQGRAGSFFVEANRLREQGDYPRAVEAHREYREAQTRFLEMALLHNRRGYPGSWEIEPIVGPLVQQSMIEAHLREATRPRLPCGTRPCCWRASTCRPWRSRRCGGRRQGDSPCRDASTRP